MSDNSSVPKSISVIARETAEEILGDKCSGISHRRGHPCEFCRVVRLLEQKMYGVFADGVAVAKKQFEQK